MLIRYACVVYTQTVHDVFAKMAKYCINVGNNIVKHILLLKS